MTDPFDAIKAGDTSVSALRNALQAIIVEMPTALNPIFPKKTYCQYTSFDGKRHCLIGELAHRVGWTVPPSTYDKSAGAAASHFEWSLSSDAAHYLIRVQYNADTATQAGNSWSQVDVS